MDLEALIQNEDFKMVLISLGILLLFLLLRKFFITYLYKFILRMSSKGKSKFFNQLLLAFEKPLQWLFVLIGVYVAAIYFPYFSHENELFSQIVQSLVIVFIVWGLVNLTEATHLLFSSINHRGNVKIDEILIPYIRRGAQVIIVAIGISVIADVFNYGIGGFVAGLGLGGLAFALAAKDVLANLFGGVVIITERPFTMGDWISTPSVEGVVEDITFRSTKVRTFSQALITVPNSTLANQPITNWSKMGKRRVLFTLKVSYKIEIEKVEKAIERIRELLNNHEGVHQETIYVNLNELLDSGVEIKFYYFTKTTDGGEYRRIKEEINYQILEIFEEEGVDLTL